MSLQEWMDLDKHLLLSMNGSDSVVWDAVMMTATSTYVWIPFFLALLYLVMKNNSFKETLCIVGVSALAVLLAVLFVSGFCKPHFARFRPTHDPEIMYIVDTVNNYRSDLFGFISGHATNTFTILVFLSLLVRSGRFTLGMFSWAIFHTYTRIYLGVHYPGDVLCGILCGSLLGVGMYVCYKFICTRWFDDYVRMSGQCSDSGYFYSDIHIVLLTFVFNCLGILFWSFFQI